MQLTLSMIERAWQRKDPALVDYIVSLAKQADPPPEQAIHDDALTWQRFQQTMLSAAFRRKTPEAQRDWRLEQMRLLEAEDAEAPLPERLKLHRIVLLLWSDDSFYARQVLLDVIQQIPLVYGPWRALKHIFKAAEQSNDYPLLGAITARLDSQAKQEFSHPTLTYLRRRAWRYLRKLGQTLPAVYPEAACHFLAAYDDQTDWANSWVANHIFYHQSQRYGISQFKSMPKPNDLLTHRAYAETWQRSPEPLLRLLSQARAEKVRAYACAALKQDFQVMLRDVEPQWIRELAALPIASSVIDEFIVWLLQNSPHLGQQQFRELGLHDSVISLLESPSDKAQQYAIQYVQAHARDLSVSHLLRLAQHEQAALDTLVEQLLSERDPRTEVGLDAWAELLQYRRHFDFSSAALSKHFGRKELTPEWFQQLLLYGKGDAFRFATAPLFELYPLESLGHTFFQTVLEKLDEDRDYGPLIAMFALEALNDLKPQALAPEFMQMLLLHPFCQDKAIDWLEAEDYPNKQLPLDFYKALAYEADWQQHPFIQKLRQSEHTWAQQLSYDDALAEKVRTWLADVRRFNPSELGFDWLMQLVEREEAHYHDFAVNLMSKAFVPADFAPNTHSEAEQANSAEPTRIDLQQQSFLFTGKLKTMTRKEASQKVSDANGKNATAVNNKLDYLVIGDEGSPMYGHGRKGSKQLKAEQLAADGANIKIISETAFLQMLAGKQREHSADATQAGCEALWTMATAKPDTPLSQFALYYLRRHHPELCLKLTDRPVDPGAEIPRDFLSMARLQPLFQHRHTPLRSFALDIAAYEFARWSPSATQLIQLSESPYEAVRDFVSQALLEEPSEANKAYRLDASRFEASAVYSFCESKQAPTRQLGMHLIKKHTQFQQPEALFQLTESPDRELRSFVVRILWSLYRHYATTRHWQPSLPPMPSQSKADQARRAAAEANLGTGLPQRPDTLPADLAALQQLLKRWLYELPPGRLNHERLGEQLKPLAASQAKKALIETFRDVAIDDADFAALILPLLLNFAHSRGKMEQAACLVAATRIQHAHPALQTGAA